MCFFRSSAEAPICIGDSEIAGNIPSVPWFRDLDQVLKMYAALLRLKSASHASASSASVHASV